MNQSLYRRFAKLTLMTCFLGLCLVSTGCDDLAGAAMEKAIEKGAGDDPERSSFAAKLKVLKEDCPKEINEYTTLKWVKLKGLNRVEFRYEISESGRADVNMNHRFALDREYAKRTLECPIAESVVKLDLGVDHVFRDTDNKQLYSTTFTRKDLKQAKLLAEKEAKQAEALAKEAATRSAFRKIESPKMTVTDPMQMAADANQMPAVTNVSNSADDWMPGELKADWRTGDNPAGVRANPYGGGQQQQSNPYAQ
ncbi:MAG: hypothetical protein HKN47_01970 [Pirellulaceae bacterium]|nr:hypothetical protein [Pirellulaceae bacterium]